MNHRKHSIKINEKNHKALSISSPINSTTRPIEKAHTPSIKTIDSDNYTN